VTPSTTFCYHCRGCLRTGLLWFLSSLTIHDVLVVHIATAMTAGGC
jgi:hypothetical protein